MTRTEFDPVFSDAVRETLAGFGTTPARAPWWRLHGRLGATLAVGGTLLLGGGAATAAYLGLPGAEDITALSAATEMTDTGPGTLEIGPAPEGATSISWSLSCLTPGTFVFDDGSSLTCSPEDAGTKYGVAWATTPAEEGQHSVSVQASPDASWTLSANWALRVVTEWAVNDDGFSYGVLNDNGDPDLIAVEASNGRSGYVWADELAEADGSAAARRFTSPEEAIAWQEERRGKSFSVPVYESDGKTVVGEFVIQ